jgi:hypothetical protein
MGRSTDVWEVEDWETIQKTIPHDFNGEVNITTYKSPTINLIKGAAHFTLIPLTKIPFPKGNYTILRAEFQIMDQDGGTHTPSSEVCNHHWLIGTKTGANP